MKQHIKLVEEFKTSLQEVLVELSDNDSIVYSSYIDTAYELNAIVMIHEYSETSYDSIHAIMQAIYTKLSNKLGYSVCISHDSPEDITILIHGDQADSQSYSRHDCCKCNTINVCNDIHDNTSHMYKTIYAAANKIAESTNTTVTKVLESLNWDRDVQSQLITMMLLKNI